MRKFLVQLTICFAFIVLVTVVLIATFANVFIGSRFGSYVSQQQSEFEQNLANGLSLQYDIETDEWNVEYIHGMGMYALEDYYIIKVYDNNGGVVWDAENHDMASCHSTMHRLMDEIAKLKENNAEAFKTLVYPLVRENIQVGTAEITHYTASVRQSDAQFLSSLNIIFILVGLISLATAVLVSLFLAVKIGKPIERLADVTEEISNGNYAIRCDEVGYTKEIITLTNSVNHMAEAIEKQEQMRRRLTSDIAHELRTPLANVHTHLEAMSEGVWEPTPERLISCQEEIERLTSIVSELERIRQIESENMSLERTEFDFKEIVENTASLFEVDMSKKNLSYIIGEHSMMIIADEKKLRQLLMNLISNAVKYSFVGGKIEIGWEENNNEWKFYVKDEGIGFSKNEAKLIFERFYRTDVSRSRETGGVGIGLTIVKAIAKAHGGTVTAESEQGKGSIFTVSLPKQ